jgi:predicted MFS family arabinose efflux permease
MTEQAIIGRRGIGHTSWARATASALCATLIGIGLARFAYTPLVPVLIGAGWFPAGDVAYLGAANLAGYLAGALLARWMTARLPAVVVIRAMMALATLSFLGCAFPLSFAWFFLWRFASGFSGGVLMVIAAAAVLPAVPAAKRGLAGGIVFTGVGLGVAASGTLVPLLLEHGIAATWCGLGALSLLLTAIGWGGWPEAPPRSGAPSRPPMPSSRALRALWVEYGLNAAGLVPHMVFLVDFVARGLGEGLGAGARAWILYGLGAAAGPLVAGQVADRLGFRTTLRLSLLVQAAAVGVLAAAPAPVALAVSSILAGAFTPGIVPIVLGRVQKLAGADAASRAAGWSWATMAFALLQAGSAYLYSTLFALGARYETLFALGAAALILALAIEVAVRPNSAARRHGPAWNRSEPCLPPRGNGAVDRTL